MLTLDPVWVLKLGRHLAENLNSSEAPLRDCCVSDAGDRCGGQQSGINLCWALHPTPRELCSISRRELRAKPHLSSLHIC